MDLAMDEALSAPIPAPEWLLKRNCSLSPQHSLCVYGSLCLVTLCTALPFLLRGAWLVLGFAFLEIAALACALYHYARHATDHEHIAFERDCLLIERVSAGRIERWHLPLRSIRVAAPRDAGRLIDLEAGNLKIQAGRFLTDAKRRQVALELKQELHKAIALLPSSA